MAQYVVTGADGNQYTINSPVPLTDEQLKLYVRREIDGVRPEPTSPDEGAGFTRGMGNALVRGGGRMVGGLEASMAEDLATVARGQDDYNRRLEAGEVPWWERALNYRPSWAAPLESSDELRGLAADKVVSQAQRDERLAEQYPMTRGGGEAIRDVMAAGSFSEGLGVVASRPLDVLSGAAQVAVEQAPSLAAAAAATAITRNPNVGMGLMGGSTYFQERFGQMGQVARDFGYDLTDPDDARRAVEDDNFLAAQEKRGVERGVTIALIDAMTFRAGAMLPMDAKGIAANTGLQVAGGAGGEAAAQLVTDGRITSPGDVIVEGLAEGPFAAVELAMSRAGREPTNTGTELDAALAAEEAALAAEQRAAAEAEATAQDLEVRSTRLDYAPTFVSENDFTAQQDDSFRSDAQDPSTPTGQAYRKHLLDNDILPTNPAEETAALEAFVRQNQKARNAGETAAAYRAGLDEHIGRMRDMENLLAPEPAPEVQLEMDFGDTSTPADAAPADAAPDIAPGQQAEMDLRPPEAAPAPAPRPVQTERPVAEGFTRVYQNAAETWTTDREAAVTAASAENISYVDLPSTDSRLQAPAQAEAAADATPTPTEVTLTEQDVTDLGGANTATINAGGMPIDFGKQAINIIKATGVKLTPEAEADIVAQMGQITSLPVTNRTGRVAGFRDLVARYTTPQKKTGRAAKAPAAAKPAAPKQTVARVPDPITVDTPVRRRQEGQAKADALLPANWTEDARYDNVNSALNGKNFNIKKFNAALSAALNPQTEAETDAAPGTDTAPDENTGAARKALVAEANKKLGADWMTKYPDIVEDLGKNKLKAVETKIAERAKPAENLPAAVDTDTAVTPDVIQNANLSGNEKKVFDTLLEAFRNNEEDTVIQPDGTWNTAEIGRRAGVGTKTANTYIKRAVGKVAKSLGATPDQMRQRLREVGRARRQGEAAPGFDAPVSVLDTAELGDSVSTKASANQGARDGMSKEDVEYLENRSKEPDAYETKRQELADKKRLADTAQTVKTYGRMAVQMWQNISSGGAVRMQDLSPNDMREWLGAVEEHAVGEINYDQLVADQREIERRYDANQGGVTMESVDGQEAIEDNAAGGGTNVDGVPSAGPVASQGGGDQTQQVRGADTGAPRTEAGQADTGVVGEAKPTPKVEVRKKRKIVKPPKFSLGDAEANAEPTVASVVKDAVKWLIGTDANWRVSVLKNPDDLVGLVLSGDLNVGSETLAEVLAKPNARGVVITDNDGVARAFFFTDNIAPGAERGVVMHEIGSHIGMDNVLTSEQKSTAVEKIKGWAEAGDKSLENLIALRAKERLGTAKRADAAQDADSELLAYFLEEAVNAGVTPNSDSKSDLVSFVRQLWADFKRALRKLRPANEPALTAQDLVNMAKGAARLELATDFHGATSAFRSVDADYFGLGNNAVGVGFYVTEDQEVGVNYMEMRMEERQSDDVDNLEGYLQRIDTAIAENEFMDWDAPLSEQPNVVEIFNQLPEEIQSGVLKQNRAQAIEDINGRQLYLGLTGVELQTQALQDYIGDAELARANRHSRGTTRAMAITSAFLDTVGIKGLKTEVTGDVRGVKAGPNPVFNKIIFNADNAVVVGRTSYGDIDYDADGAPQLRPGTVKFSVGDPVGGPQVDWVARNLGNGAAEHASNLIEVAKAPVTATKNLRRVIRDVEKKMPSARKWYDAMLASEKTRNSVLGMVESVVNQARTIKKERKALVNDFLATSTFYQKWGYDPQWTDANGTKIAVTIDPIMKAKYDRLTAEEQQLVRDVFEHGRKIQQMMQKVAKDLGVSQFFRLDSKLNGPYAPLKRFGDYVGQLKSQDLLDAEAALERDKTPKARELVEKLKSDPKHYVVSFFANKGTAETFVRENRGSFAYAVASEKAVDFDTARPGGAQVYEKILGAINANAAGLDQSAKDAMAKMVRDMYFQTLDDSNARLSGLRRLNRAGFEKDMLRSFAAHGSAQANLIAQLQHGADIAGALVEAKREAGRDASRLMPVYNQLATKFRAVMTPRTGALARFEDGVMKFNSFYMLTSSMGYFFQNQTQPIYAVAQIAGDLGYTKQPAVFGKLLSGYGVARKVVNTGWLRQAANVASMGLLGKNAAVELDLQQAPPEIRPVLQAMQDRGVLDVGVAEDLSRFSISSEGNLVSRGYREMTHRLYQSARYVESMNRIASAVAAFKIAQQNPAKMRKLGMTPLEYALSVVEDTQGNFSQLDAPALFDAVPIKAPLQFRKFQFQMAWLHVDALNQAFRGADMETKVAGFRKASLLMGYTGILGGLVSVPMSSAVSAIVQAVLSGLSGDDEENPPRSLERWIRENVEDERTATLLARGVPAALGWDFSQKLDQSDIFMPFSTKYVELNPDRDGYLLALAQIGLGATGTMVGNLGNVHDFVNRGDLYRAAEYALPKGLRAYMETLRFAERGMETRAGLELQSPTDFSVFDMLTNVVGLPSTEINQIRWTRGQQIEIEQWFTARSSAIKRDYLDAYDARDRAGMAEARDAFRELNAARDRVRPFFGDSRQVLRRQPLSNLLRAPRDRSREQRKLDSIMGR